MAHTLAVGGGRVTVTATIGARPPELCRGRRSRRAAAGHDDGLRVDGRPRVARDALRGGTRARRANRDVDRFAGRLPGTMPLPTVVDVHGGPLGAWSPAPSLEVVLLCARGYRVVLPEHPRLDVVRRRVDPAAAGRLGRTRRRRRPCRPRPRDRARPRRPGPARRAGPVVRRVHGQLAGRERRTGSGRPSPRTA